VSDELLHADSGVDLAVGVGVHAGEEPGVAAPTGWIVLSKHRLVYAPSIVEVNPATRRERSVSESWTDPNIRLNNGHYVWVTNEDIKIVKEALAWLALSR
jgi:hypothetical protein